MKRRFIRAFLAVVPVCWSARQDPTGLPLSTFIIILREHVHQKRYPSEFCNTA